MIKLFIFLFYYVDYMFNRDVFNDIYFRIIFRMTLVEFIKESKITKIDDGRERSARGETAFFVHKELLVIETSPFHLPYGL